MRNETHRQPWRRHRRWARVVVAVACLMGGLIMAVTPAGAQDDTDLLRQFGFVDVIEANGLIDDVLADFISRSLDDSVELGARAVVLQMESDGSTLDDDELARLVDKVRNHPVPTSVWLGPANSGAARGGAGVLAAATDRIGISPGSELELPSGEVLGYDELLGSGTAFDFEVQDAPALLNHLLELDEFEFTVYQPGDTLPDGAEVVDEPVRLPETGTRFVTLPLIEQQFHTFASPAIAYLLFVIGLALLVFELFTAGIGIAGVIGAGSLLAGGYGLGVLEARWWAVGLLSIAFIGFAVDVQSGIQQFWSGVGVVFLIIGSLFLLPDHSVGWLPLLVGILGMCLAMLSGMPAMVRTRFSTPTIGREWMIGSIGDVVEAVDPDGVVDIDGAPWRARTNRATPLAVGDRARVIEVDGLLLEVEPETGGAVDYRERR